MLVVVASRYDRHAQMLVSDHGEARLLTSEDLSSRGWRFEPGGGGDSSAVIGGEVVDCRDVEGVLTRLPCVFAGDLVNIVPDDRGYVAAEMTAFLAAWLSNLKCPVLNRPTPLCLSGPFLRRERWVHTAAHLGIPVLPVNRHAPTSVDETTSPASPGLVSVSLVGDACVGKADERLASQTRTLARSVGVDLLRARFTSPAEGSLFVDADYWADLSDPEIAAAILSYLRSGA
jgi:hypothetical protein